MFPSKKAPWGLIGGDLFRKLIFSGGLFGDRGQFEDIGYSVNGHFLMNEGHGHHQNF